MRALNFVWVFVFIATLEASAQNYATEFRFPVGNAEEQTWRESNSLGNSWASYYGHLGADYVSSNAANDPVCAIANGTIYRVYRGGPSWRGVVIVKHELPLGQSFNFTGTVLDSNQGTNPVDLNVIYSLSGHMFNIQVSEGALVEKGQVLGYLCDTCIDHPDDCSEEEVSWIPHIHFEIKNQDAIDSAAFGGVGHGYSGIHMNAPNHYNPTIFIENQLATNPTWIFHDISNNHWAWKNIADMKGRGIMNGLNGYFYPDNSISRGEICTMIVRARGLQWEDYPHSNPFSDISGSTHCNNIIICYHAGFVNGYGDGTFRPNNAVLRREISKMVCRGFEISTYQDMDEVWSDYAVNDDNFEYAYALKKSNVLSGYPDGRFGPDNNLTRAEAAKIFSNALALE